uniref:G-protein coupled receptor 151 protein-like n=1 Tax=Euleptes europaea TaxID=460621 RepID=UPI00253F8727|nr:G-protein coupled receptor 151 protein-like [Euleptes europaea]
MNSSRAVVAAAPRWWRAAGGGAAGVVLPSLLAGVGLAGLAGNLLLGALLARGARRGQAPPASRLLLLNLCAADLLLALCCLPARLAASWRGAWPLGGFLCRATEWLLHGCPVAKSLSWAAVGQAHCHHLRAPPRSRGWGGRRLAGLLAALWLAALLLPLPLFLFSRLEGAPPSRRLHCVFRSPPDAAAFMDVFGKVYPLAAYLAPSGFTWACYGRALRLQAAREPAPRARTATRLLLALSLLFQAMWLPAWVAWLWERHGPPPPPALGFLAEGLVFLNGAVSPGVLVASSEELREGLSGVWTGLRCGRRERGPAGAGAGPDPPREAAAAAEKALPDVEHFWKERRSAAAGEESDPVPWERQGEP